MKPWKIFGTMPVLPRYTLWVNTFGTAYRVHRLTSQDGFNWSWSPRIGADGELSTGATGAYDDRHLSFPVMTADGIRDAMLVHGQ